MSRVYERANLLVTPDPRFAHRIEVQDHFDRNKTNGVIMEFKQWPQREYPVPSGWHHDEAA